jgi:hypothetical protein
MDNSLFQYGRYAVFVNNPSEYILKNLETGVTELSTPTLFNAMQWAIKSENAVQSLLNSITANPQVEKEWTEVLASAQALEPPKSC